MKSLLALALAAAFFVTTALCGPAAAIAGTQPSVDLGSAKGVSYARATVPDVFTRASQSADCPSGTEATGGGAAVTGPAHGIEVNKSYPREGSGASPDGWTILAGTTGSSQDVSAFVACASTDAQVATASESVSAANAASQNPSCPSGYQSTGGGVSAPGTAVLLRATFPRLPQPTPTGTWQGVGSNHFSVQVLTFYTVCSRTFLINYRRSDSVRLQSGEGGKAIVSCKPSEAVLGGGIAAFREGEPYARLVVNATRPRDSKADGNKVPDDGWLARGYNLSPDTSRLRAFAACKAGIAPE